MNRMIKIIVGLLLIAAVGFTQNVSAARTYKAYDLGVLPDEVYGEASSINQRGEIVGFSILADETEHPFVLQKRKTIDLGAFDEAMALDVNDLGQVVGWIQSSDDIYGFVWKNGEISSLETLEGIYSSGNGINNLGEIVGSANTVDGYSHAVVWKNGSIIDLGTLGGDSSEAEDINENGQIVGSSRIANAFYHHAFLWEKGTMIDLGTLGGQESYAYAINERGQIVGKSQTLEGIFHGFLWWDGVMIDLGSLSGSWSIARAINDRGQIVGEAAISQYDSSAFLWENGTMLDLGGERSRALDINNNGKIVGKSSLGPTLWAK